MLFCIQVKGDIRILATLMISRSTLELPEIFSMGYKRISKCPFKCTALTRSYITLVSTH